MAYFLIKSFKCKSKSIIKAKTVDDMYHKGDCIVAFETNMCSRPSIIEKQGIVMAWNNIFHVDLVFSNWHTSQITDPIAYMTKSVKYNWHVFVQYPSCLLHHVTQRWLANTHTLSSSEDHGPKVGPIPYVRDFTKADIKSPKNRSTFSYAT